MVLEPGILQLGAKMRTQVFAIVIQFICLSFGSTKLFENGAPTPNLIFPGPNFQMPAHVWWGGMGWGGIRVETAKTCNKEYEHYLEIATSAAIAR